MSCHTARLIYEVYWKRREKEQRMGKRLIPVDKSCRRERERAREKMSEKEREKKRERDQRLARPTF